MRINSNVQIINYESQFHNCIFVVSFLFRLGGDLLKTSGGESDDDYNDVDWSLYQDKKGNRITIMPQFLV